MLLKMTSRERVLAALNHQEPDRVPLDLGGTFVSSITVKALDRLRRHLGLEQRPIKVTDCWQMLGEVEMDLVERLQLDCLPVNPPVLTMGLRMENYKPWTLMDGTEVLVPGEFTVDVDDRGGWLFPAGGPYRCRMPRDGHYFDDIDSAGWDMDWEPPSLESLRPQYSRPSVTDEELAWLQERALPLRRDTDKCLILGGWSYHGLTQVGSLTNFLTLLAADPGYVKELFAMSTERALMNYELLWQALGDSVDVIAVSGLDFGTQRSEWFSPEIFREVYVPALTAHFDWIHQHTTWKTFLHSCGSLARIVGDLADAGLDALNPVQTSAHGMDPMWLKQTYGDRLTFWGGGVETQSTLPFGTPDQVRAEVRERIRIFAPGGGFVFNPIHNIQPDTPAENIVAAYEAALEFGQYPLSTQL